LNNRKPGSTPAKDLEIDLNQLLKIIHKHIKLIIALTLLLTLTSGLVSHFVLKPVYQATTLLMVTVASDKLDPEQQMPQIDPTTGASRSIMPVLTMNTYLGQLKSEAMMKRVIDKLGLSGYTIDDMSEMIKASIVEDSNLIEVKVLNNSPDLAYRIANTLSDEYLSLTQEFMFSSVVVISPANVPTKPVKPNKTFNIILAFIMGLIFSGLLSYFLESMDNTVKTVGQVYNELNLPVLGLIPAQNRRNSRQRSYGR